MQQDCASLRLSHEQIWAAVAINISRDQGPRRIQLDGIKADFSSYIFEPVPAQVTEQPDFSVSSFCFADGCQINPAIIVIIQRSQSPGSSPIFDWELHLLHALAIQVAPQRNARNPIMVERHIDPAILPEVH